MDFNKYNPLAKAIQPTLPSEILAAEPSVMPDPIVKEGGAAGTLNSWRDSSTVIRLSEYLKRCKPHGITLHAFDRSPVLQFRPGLTVPDLQGKTERGEAAHHALGLLFAAASDLRHLMAEGLIELPKSEVTAWTA